MTNSNDLHIFLDDERYPATVTWERLPDVDWTIVRTPEEFKATVLSGRLIKTISFDNDLGEDDGVILEQGRDMAVWLVEQWLDGIVSYNPDIAIIVHRRNTVAAPWIRQYFEAYRQHREDEGI